MTRPSSNSPPFWLEPLPVFVLGLLVRIAFIHLHPAIYGGDTLVRIMNADRVLLAYQLPLLQLLIYLVNLVSSDPWLIRFLMSLVGALAGMAFYLFSATLLERRTARLASLFFIFNPFLLVHSIVPYQEILMLLLLCLGLYCILRPALHGNSSPYASPKLSVPPWTRGDFRRVEEVATHGDLRLTRSMYKEGERRIACASLFLGLACLTRYEAWVITAAAGLYYTRLQLNGRSVLNYLRLLAKATVLFGWAPLLWILLHRGVSPQGTYVLEGPATWARLWRIPYVSAMTLYHAGPIVGLLATLGLLTFWKASLWRKQEIRMIVAAAALLMFSLVFSAHGVEPDPQRFVTDREAHWFILFPFWAAALGLSDVKQRVRPKAETSHPKRSTAFRKLRTVIYYLALIVAVVWGTVQTDRYVKRLLADQNLILDYAVAQYLERNLPPGSKALVFAKPLPPDATQEYLDKVYFHGGAQALHVARRQLAEINSGPLDYSRIVVNTRLGKNQVVDASKLIVKESDVERFLPQNHVRLAAVFSNYPADEVNTRHLLDYVKHRGKHLATLADRGLQVSIYEVLF
jgi:hypothetical protein